MLSLRQCLSQGGASLGMALCYNCPGIVERIGKEWDWIWIDAQHGQFAYQDVVSAVRVAELVGSRPVIRPPGHGAEWLGMYADLLPAGIMVPMVNDAAQATAVVEALRFPPVGKRSFGSRRAGDMFGPTYPRDFDLFVMAQVETVEAVENAHAIIGTPGIDCLFFGANDVKLDMGLPLDVPEHESARLHAAMERTAAAAKRAGKWAGCVANSEIMISHAKQMGYSVLACGADQLFLREGSAAALRMARGVTGRKAPSPPLEVTLHTVKPPAAASKPARV